MATPNAAAPVPQGPGYGGFAITPSDSTVFTNPTRQIWVGGTGTLSVLMQGGGTVLIEAIPTGTMLYICATKVLAASTATKIIGFF